MMEYSFIIPVYNCKDYLSTCVESIRAVGTELYEILLIDDGSTDGSGTLCDTLAAQYPQIRVVQQENSGASAARNRGLREARGEWILILDADDGIASETIGTVLKDHRRHQAEMVIFGMTFDYYYHGSCYRRDPLYFETEGILTEETWCNAFKELFLRNSLSPVWNKMYRREILQRYALEMREDMFLYEDLEFVLRYMGHCGNILNIPKAIYYYRQPEDEGNAGRRLARIESIPALLKRIEEALAGLETVCGEQKDNVLLALHQCLAKEKIAVSDLAGIRRICRDYAGWYQQRGLTGGENTFHQRLTEGKAVSLLLQSKKTALRHKIAVRVKACLKRMR